MRSRRRQQRLVQGRFRPTWTFHAARAAKKEASSKSSCSEKVKKEEIIGLGQNRGKSASRSKAEDLEIGILENENLTIEKADCSCTSASVQIKANSKLFRTSSGQRKRQKRHLSQSRNLRNRAERGFIFSYVRICIELEDKQVCHYVVL